MVDAEGVALLPAKADPDNRRTWLPLSRILDSVKKFRGQRLLILDLRPVADLRLGQRGDELAPALHTELALNMGLAGAPNLAAIDRGLVRWRREHKG